MIEIVTDFAEETIVLENSLVRKAAQNAIEAIKNEIPEEAQTVEAVEHVISEISQLIREKRVVL